MTLLPAYFPETARGLTVGQVMTMDRLVLIALLAEWVESIGKFTRTFDNAGRTKSRPCRTQMEARRLARGLRGAGLLRCQGTR